MKKLFALLAALLSLGNSSADQQYQGIDYEKSIHLDAENLAESGMRNGYAKVLPALRKYVKSPASVKEFSDNRIPEYSIVSSGMRYKIYGPSTTEGQSWGNATFALFDLVNRQLAKSTHRFYAINGGNDLAGVFLTEEQAKTAISMLKNKSDWPYIPTKDRPWYGMHH